MPATRSITRPTPQNQRLHPGRRRAHLPRHRWRRGRQPEVLKAFEEELARSNVLAVIRPREDRCEGRCASVTGTGCQGLCAMDPLVEIHLRRNGTTSKVTYGQVTPAMVPRSSSSTSWTAR